MSNRLNRWGAPAILAFGIVIGIVADNVLDSQPKAEAQTRLSLSALDSRLAAVEAGLAALVSDVTAQEAAAAPIGSIVAIHLDMPVPVPPGTWVPCDGQLVTDPDSPLVGLYVPDLNADGRFLRGGLQTGLYQNAMVGPVTVSGTVTYNDYYWEDSGYDGLYATPSGDDVGQRVQASRTASFSASGGGSETRPINMSVCWSIRIK